MKLWTGGLTGATREVSMGTAARKKQGLEVHKKQWEAFGCGVNGKMSATV